MCVRLLLVLLGSRFSCRWCLMRVGSSWCMVLLLLVMRMWLFFGRVSRCWCVVVMLLGSIRGMLGRVLCRGLVRVV